MAVGGGPTSNPAEGRSLALTLVKLLAWHGTGIDASALTRAGRRRASLSTVWTPVARGPPRPPRHRRRPGTGVQDGLRHRRPRSGAETAQRRRGTTTIYLTARRFHHRASLLSASRGAVAVLPCPHEPQYEVKDSGSSGGWIEERKQENGGKRGRGMSTGEKEERRM